MHMGACCGLDSCTMPYHPRAGLVLTAHPVSLVKQPAALLPCAGPDGLQPGAAVAGAGNEGRQGEAADRGQGEILRSVRHLVLHIMCGCWRARGREQAAGAARVAPTQPRYDIYWSRELHPHAACHVPRAGRRRAVPHGRPSLDSRPLGGPHRQRLAELGASRHRRRRCCLRRRPGLLLTRRHRDRHGGGGRRRRTGPEACAPAGGRHCQALTCIATTLHVLWPRARTVSTGRCYGARAPSTHFHHRFA